jgi:aspartyl-tRNA(Asn)/glutamyl-tRNA(Gln) amidotransferase subunit A
MVTIDEARAQVAAASAATVAERHYDLIEANDGIAGKAIHSFLALSRERAMRQAERMDARAAKGEPLGPLAGVPVGIKDVLVMQGAPATAGSRILEGYRPPYDATAVKKLEAAGAS